MAVQDVVITPVGLPGLLELPEGAQAIVLFAHGSGSSRFSPRNTQVARGLNEAGPGTLPFDLLTAEEGADRAKDLRIIPHATHLFEEPGTLEVVIAEARQWSTGRLIAHASRSGEARTS